MNNLKRHLLVLDAVRYTHARQAIPYEFLASPRRTLRCTELDDRLHLGSPTAESSTLAVPSTPDTSARGAPTDVRHQ